MTPQFSGTPSLGLITGVNEFVLVKMAAQQTTNKAVGDHVKFDTILGFRGGLYITADVLSTYSNVQGAPSIGRFTLKAGPTYLLEYASKYVDYGGVTGTAIFSWHDATAGVNLGAPLRCEPLTTIGHFATGASASAIITPTVDTLVEMRIIEFQTGTISAIGLATRSEPSALIRTI